MRRLVLRAVSALKGNFYVGVLATFFGQNFDAKVVALMIVFIVTVNLTVQKNCARVRSDRLTCHCQFFRRNRLPVVGQAGNRE
jgi:hypothetical protein